GAGQAHLPGNVALVADGEIPLVKGVSLSQAILDKFLDGRLDQPHAAIVAVQLHVADQLVDRAKPALILIGPNQLHILPFVEHDFRAEIADDEGERLAVIAIGRVADEAGSGVGPVTQEQHGEPSYSTAGASRSWRR